MIESCCARGLISGVVPSCRYRTRPLCADLSSPISGMHCDLLQELLLGANPATDNSEAFTEVARPAQQARPGLDIVWRAAGGGTDQPPI